MRSLFLILLTTSLSLGTLSACAECNVKEGRYTSIGGSEQSTSLTLSSNKSFTALHEAWQPGHYEKRDISKLSGTWSCNNNNVTLEVQDKNYRAELIVIGKNPLGLNADGKALLFENNEIDKDSYLNNEILYPDF